SFKDEVVVRSLVVEWTDPRGNIVHAIRAGAHKPIEIRKRGFVLSQLWRLVKQPSLDSHLWKEGISSLGTNAYKGSLHYSNDIDAWELFKVEEDGTSYRVGFRGENLDNVSITSDQAAAMIAKLTFP
ncbi:unnamed protein product, partial [Prorocentrum cordatum]